MLHRSREPIMVMLTQFQKKNQFHTFSVQNAYVICFCQREQSVCESMEAKVQTLKQNDGFPGGH